MDRYTIRAVTWYTKRAVTWYTIRTVTWYTIRAVTWYTLRAVTLYTIRAGTSPSSAHHPTIWLQNYELQIKWWDYSRKYFACHNILVMCCWFYSGLLTCGHLDSSAGIVTRLWEWQSGDPWQQQQICVFSKILRLSLGPTQPLFNGYCGSLLAVKWLWGAADRSPPSNIRVEPATLPPHFHATSWHAEGQFYLYLHHKGSTFNNSSNSCKVCWENFIVIQALQWHSSSIQTTVAFQKQFTQSGITYVETVCLHPSMYLFSSHTRCLRVDSC